MIHCFERAGLKLVLDTPSGAVHVLDAPAYALLQTVPQPFFAAANTPPFPIQLLDEYGEETLKESFIELRNLIHKGLLYAADDYKQYAGQLGEAPVKAMCLHVAHDCNLRCKYCFASTGGFGGNRQLMPFEVAKKAIDLLVVLSEGRRNLEVDFFGGEPLMNFDVVRAAVDYARCQQARHNKNFRFTITTNGLLLNDDTIDYINREMGNVVLSIDGRRVVNDRMRPLTNGAGSYDVILPKFQKLVKKRGDKEYYVRGTYTRHNLDFDADVQALFAAGFGQISVEPVVGPDTEAYTIQPRHLPAIEASYVRLMDSMIERSKNGEPRYNFFHFMLDLENGPCAIKRLKGCGCGNEYLAVTPDGELFPCHQFVGQPQYKMGSVDEGITQVALRRQFACANLLNKPSCRECWAKYHCSGGCNANNSTYCNSVYTPHELSCQLEKIRLECGIALKAHDMLRAAAP